jgi:N-acetylmuramoyl-L-alanine amidase
VADEAQYLEILSMNLDHFIETYFEIQVDHMKKKDKDSNKKIIPKLSTIILVVLFLAFIAPESSKLVSLCSAIGFACPSIFTAMKPGPFSFTCYAANSGHVIAIDPGHQAKGNSEKEPIGPGASKTKAKVATGTCGVATKTPESELCLSLGLKLQAELISRGYTVVMTRTTNDVNISNSERAKVANEACADAFIRIHANGSENHSVSGATALCQTKNNPYNGALADSSYSLSKSVLDCLVDQTKCKKLSIQQTDTMSGINWCTVPVTIIEVGFMSNPTEDRLMETDDYQNNIAIGIANGIDAYIMGQ